MQKFFQILKSVFSWIEKHKFIVAIIATVVFVAVSIPFMQNHEFSDDEIVSWENSKTLFTEDYFEVNQLSPVSPLWQLVLSPFSKSGVSIQVLHVIPLVLVALAVFLLFAFAPFKAITKLILMFSAGFFYYNPVIGTEFSLIPLLLVLLAICYPARSRLPLIYGVLLALLACPNFLMFGLVAVLVLGFVCEEIKSRKNFLLTLLSILAVLLPVAVSVYAYFAVLTYNFEVEPQFYFTHKEIYVISEGFDVFHALDTELFGVGLPLIEIVVLIFFLTQLGKNLKLALYAPFSLVWIYVAIWQFSPVNTPTREAATVLLILMFILWITFAEDAPFVLKSKASELSKTSAVSETDNFSKLLENRSKLTKFFNKILNKSELYSLVAKHFTIPSVIFFVILFGATIPHTVSAANVDYKENYAFSDYVAVMFNLLPEDSVIVIADKAGSITSRSASSLLTGNRKIYNVATNDFSSETIYNYDYYVILSNYEIIDDASETESDESNSELTAELKKLAEEYEHVYLWTYIKSCGDPGHQAITSTLPVANFATLGDVNDPNLVTMSLFRYK